jgi:SnoaL-like domain
LQVSVGFDLERLDKAVVLAGVVHLKVEGGAGVVDLQGSDGDAIVRVLLYVDLADLFDRAIGRNGKGVNILVVVARGEEKLFIPRKAAGGDVGEGRTGHRGKFSRRGDSKAIDVGWPGDIDKRDRRAGGVCSCIAQGERQELEFRLTIALKKIDGQWTIMHEHHSVPASD